MLSYIDICEKKIVEVKAHNTVVATCASKVTYAKRKEDKSNQEVRKPALHFVFSV